MSKNTWKRVLCVSNASCWVRLDSRVAVPIPRPPMNLCRASCKTTPRFNRKFTTAAHIFHATSTIPIPRYYPFTFGIRTIVDHVSSVGGVPHPNVCCTNLTKISHRILTGSFLRVASHRHPFKYSARIPGGPPGLTPFRPFTAVYTSVSVDILS